MLDEWDWAKLNNHTFAITFINMLVKNQYSWKKMLMLLMSLDTTFRIHIHINHTLIPILNLILIRLANEPTRTTLIIISMPMPMSIILILTNTRMLNKERARRRWDSIISWARTCSSISRPR